MDDFRQEIREEIDRFREQGVFKEIYRPDFPPVEIKKMHIMKAKLIFAVKEPRQPE